jgi:hypothetical protein
MRRHVWEFLATSAFTEFYIAEYGEPEAVFY